MAVVPSERERREVDHGSAVHAEVRVSSASKSDFDQAWAVALQTFAQSGNWGEPKRVCATSGPMELRGEGMS